MKDLVIYLVGHYQDIIQVALMALGALSAFLLALYNLALVIPGEQPDKAIKAIYDFTLKFSKKKEEPAPPAEPGK
jgi:hypothetical protein